MRKFWTALRVFPLIAALICFFSLPSAAASNNGISASVTEAAPGDSFTVFIDVPRSSNGDTLSIRVEYDPDVFEIVSWDPDIPNCISNIGDGFIAATSANVQRVIDLGSGMHLTAEAVVKRNAPTGGSDLRLTSSSISYVKDNGYEYVELWEPKNLTARVRVSGSSSGNSAVTERGGRNTGTADETEEIYDPDEDPVDPVDPVDDEESIYDDDPDDDDEVIRVDDEEEDGPVEPDDEDDRDGRDEPYFPQPVSDAKISLDSRLTGLSEGKIRLSTKSYFFENDTVIELRDTDPYGDGVKRAAANLGFEYHDRYSFDITLRETDTGRTLSSLGNGYIELAMPLPERMKTSPGALKVYHIEDGFGRPVASSITIEDGTAKICFRANAFSTYMIMDTENEYYPEPVIISGDTTGNKAGRPINPATGVAAAVIIPAALVGCVILAKKNGKRKRANKHQGGENDDEKE